jgi:RimJ/RimL family protein N-acetyltransferase
MLRGEFVELRPIDRANIDAYVRWLTDPEVTRTLNIHGTPITRESEEAWFEEATKPSADSFLFGIHLLDDGQLVGNTGLHVIDWRNRCGTFGIFIGEKDWWGKGLGPDALKIVVRFAFEDLNLHRVQLDVFEFNERGIRAYAKVGFKEEGRRREALFRDGRFWDVIEMSLLESEWNQEPKTRTTKRRAQRPGTKPGGTRRPKR